MFYVINSDSKEVPWGNSEKLAIKPVKSYESMNTDDYTEWSTYMKFYHVFNLLNNLSSLV